MTEADLDALVNLRRDLRDQAKEAGRRARRARKYKVQLRNEGRAAGLMRAVRALTRRVICDGVEG